MNGQQTSIYVLTREFLIFTHSLKLQPLSAMGLSTPSSFGIHMEVSDDEVLWYSAFSMGSETRI